MSCWVRIKDFVMNESFGGVRVYLDTYALLNANGDEPLLK
jgi:hypothetical protein